MRGNTFGKLFSMTSFGESHGAAMGVVVDGMPSKIDVDIKDLQKEVDRRAPGRSGSTSSRQEMDQVELLSGVFEGKTLGTPICVIVRNMDQRSQDYDHLKDSFRIGHADETTQLKYGIRDHRGGGRASGRETISRVIAGYFANLFLQQVCKLEVKTRIVSLGKLVADDSGDISNWQDYLSECKQRGESVGGELQVRMLNCPAGLGEPCFDKLKADLSKAMLSIGGCVGFSYGAGADLVGMTGEQMVADRVNLGGIEGGISTGGEIKFNVLFKPIATFGDKAKNGRHDPSIIPRVIPVVESMARIVLADHYLRQKAYSY